jgi:hypothetical protein
MQSALSRLLDEEVELLKGKRLDKDYFHTLLTGGDPTRDLLQWLDREEEFKAARPESEWKAFVEVCKSQLGFYPDSEGVLTGAMKLAEHEGPWQAVWDRFCEAPGRYSNLPGQIRKCKAPTHTIYWHSGDKAYDGWPQWNQDQEQLLRRDLLDLVKVPTHEARKKLLGVEKKHGKRRMMVWAELGPRGTGKSHLFQQVSPYAHLISGGKATVAKMFVNNSTGQRGLVCQYDVVCFDEVSGISFDQKDGVNILMYSVIEKEHTRWPDSCRRD